jgi:hypothetical protein
VAIVKEQRDPATHAKRALDRDALLLPGELRRLMKAG